MSEKKNIEIINWTLLTKYLNNEITSDEKTEVENWLNKSDRNRAEMEKCRKMLTKVDSYYKAKSFNSNTAWKNVSSKIYPMQFKVVQRKKRKEKIAQFYKYAAILVVAILLGGVGYYIDFRNEMPLIFSQTVSAEKQVLNEFVLPDGSVVTLNSNSKLKFPKHFADDVREVTIIGEAFFEVKPNPEKPFVINAGKTQIKVLGTSFNVSAYPETETVEVVVATGKVLVTRESENLLSENNRIFLIPGEKGTLFVKSNRLEKSVNSNLNYLAWKTNDLIFNETPLNEVVKCLEKVYHIEIQLVEPGLETLKLTAHFDKKPIDFVLNVVRLTFNLELMGENEHFTLSSRINKQVKP
ncbi:MAG: FecR domain-containing protein [Draconibacterium sp.]|nr:FecR domain-containing protein [Draconibacterium sp.]